MKNSILYNGQYFHQDDPLIPASSRALRYGEGLFETMYYENGKIRLFDYHMERLFSGLELLKFTLPAVFTPRYLEEQVRALLSNNQNTGPTRVRLSVFRGSENITSFSNLLPNTLIETFPLPKSSEEADDLTLGIYKTGTRNTDIFSNLKSAQYLLSAMSLIEAAEKGFDECLLLNHFGRICESSKANVFCIMDNHIITPPATEGCVEGVLRQFIIDNQHILPLPLTIAPLTLDMVFKADEVFLTNAISPVRTVSMIEDKKYGSDISASVKRTVLDKMF